MGFKKVPLMPNTAPVRKGMKKAEDEDEAEGGDEKEGGEAEGGEGGEEEGEGEEKEEKAYRKSHDAGVTVDDLRKGLDRLDAYAQTSPATRKETLLSKAQSEELSKSETEELFRLLGNQEDGSSQLASQLTKGLTQNAKMQEAFDVSDFLAEQTGQLVKSLGDLGAQVEQSGARQHEFNVVLAKAVADTARLAAAMSERLGVIESQPARQPKSRLSGAQALNKSFGAQPGGEPLGRGQMLKALEGMMDLSKSEGRPGVLRCGQPIDLAVAELESAGTANPSVQAEVREFLRAMH
jgi:hypothetical protein